MIADRHIAVLTARAVQHQHGRVWPVFLGQAQRARQPHACIHEDLAFARRQLRARCLDRAACHFQRKLCAALLEGAGEPPVGENCCVACAHGGHGHVDTVTVEADGGSRYLRPALIDRDHDGAIAAFALFDTQFQTQLRCPHVQHAVPGTFKTFLARVCAAGNDHAGQCGQ